MECITYALGLKVNRRPWKNLKKMPYYIQDKFDIEEATLGDVRTLFMHPKAELDHIAALKKQFARIQKTENLPVVIVLSTMSRYRRDAFAEAKIPFVVPVVSAFPWGLYAGTI